MTTGLKFERHGFDKTLQIYLNLQSKTVAEGLNRKAYNVVIRAAKFTPKADKSQIRKWMKSKDGQNWIGSLFGRKLIRFDTKKAATKKITSLAIRSVGYLKAGWVTPMRALKKAAGIKAKGSIKGGTQRKPAKGSAEPAKDWRKTKGSKSEVTFTNATGAQSGSDKKGKGQLFSQAEAAKQFGEPALKKGFTAAKADMQKYILRKLKEAAKKSGAA